MPTASRLREWPTHSLAPPGSRLGRPPAACPRAPAPRRPPSLGVVVRSSDSALLLRREVVDSWLQLWAGLALTDRDAARDVWRAIASEVRPHEWGRFPGPAPDTLATLRRAGWAPTEPDRWAEPQPTHDERRTDAEHLEARQAVLQRFDVAVQRCLWGRAHLHCEGAGLGVGAHARTVALFVMKIGARGKSEQAAALRLAATGAMWPPMRVARCFPDLSSRCPRCHAPPRPPRTASTSALGSVR